MLAKAYEPKTVESKWQEHWKNTKAFAAEEDPKRTSYCVVIPPPNVTGVLHMGHILNNTLQDIFIRRARLEGKQALWMPGTDHAGIATQTMVEKKLRSEGKTKYDLGREAFLKEVWKWRQEHGDIILHQLRKLGASCDWDRTTFTLDEGYSKAVLTAFVRLYKRGLIYRGKRMINWCPVSQTALSDEEVIPKHQTSTLYRMRYAFVDQPDEYLEIATTRPETIMGDTAVAVHPNDKRYLHLIGKYVWRPFPKAKIPIIADEHVDPEFGSGALKVTPAHDNADFEIGLRHGLKVIDVLNPDGTLNEKAGEPFVGMDRFEARKRAAEELKRLDLLVAEELYENTVGFSERGGVPIEPRLSEQWFLKYPRVEEAKEVVREKLITFHPQRWAKTYLHWLDNIRDWCISRQLWWGHRIPVWYRKGGDRSNPDNWHVSVEGPSDPEHWEQDSDVLDTWASSWLWPFAVFGWPEGNEQQKRELAYFYPTEVLCTGFDIIFFWVARMIMAGLELMGEEKKGLSPEDLSSRIPFKDVYITGLIRDSQGRKMSKSLGNSPNPLDLIDQFGADGLRFGIINIAPSGQDILFSENRIEIGRNFCNKLWNACRFRQMNGDKEDNSSLAAILERIDPAHCDGYDHWILDRLIAIHQNLEKDFESFEMHPITHQLHNFFWGEFCDWYVEASKDKIREKGPQRDTSLAVQDLVIRQLLLLLHPITPHITEELWLQLGYSTEGGSIQITQLETTEALKNTLAERNIDPSPETVAAIEAVQAFVTQARSLKADYQLIARRDLSFYLKQEPAQAEIFQANEKTVLYLVGAAKIERTTDLPEGLPVRMTELGSLALDLSQAIDVDAEKEKLAKKAAELKKVIRSAEGKLNNQRFLDNAPLAVIDGTRKQLTDNKEKLAGIEQLLSSL